MRRLVVVLLLLWAVPFSASQSLVISGQGRISGPGNISISPGSGNPYCDSAGAWIGPSTDGGANFPIRCYNTSLANTPSPGTVWPAVSTLSGLNSTYAGASCGDTLQITAGSIISGPWSPTGKGCDDAHYITVKTTGVSNPNFPAENTRTTPCWSNVASLPNRPAYPCASPTTLTAQFVAPNSGSGVVLNGTDHIRFIGLEFTRPTTPHLFIYTLADLTSSSTFTNHIIFDRCWFHGVNQDGNFPQTNAGDTSTVRGVVLGQANYVGIIDSYFSDFYVNGTVATTGNTDAQAISGGYGSATLSNWGAYKIVDNHLEGSTEGILLGGAGGPALTPSGCTVFVNCNLDVPTDIEVRSNYFFKSRGWISPTAATFGWPVIKNGFEMKNGARGFFEGNVVENVIPGGGQPGYSWSVAPKNQPNSGPSPVGQCLTCQTNDLIYRYNYAYNVSYGIGLYASMDIGCTSCASQGANRISMHDNLIDDINVPSPYLGNADDFEFSANLGSPIQNVNLSHNTFAFAIRSAFNMGAATTGLMTNWTLQNNIVAQGTYGVTDIGTSCDTPFDNSNLLYGMMNACFTPYTYSFNALFNATMSPLGKNYPTDGNGLNNFFYSSAAGVGFTNYNSGNSNFTPSNYQLTSGSPLHNAGSDGKDLGPSIPTLINKIAGVRL